MRFGLLVMAAQVSAQNDASTTMQCHKLRYSGRPPESPQFDACNQTGSWLEEGATTCFFGYDDNYAEYAGCGQQINCKEKYDNALAKGLVSSSTATFCVRNFSGFDVIETLPPGSGSGSSYTTDTKVHLCCMAITSETAHDDTNTWGEIMVGNVAELEIYYMINNPTENNITILTNDDVAAVATEDEEEDDYTLEIVLGSIGGLVFLGGAAYIIKKKVYDEKASFMPLEFLL